MKWGCRAGESSTAVVPHDLDLSAGDFGHRVDLLWRFLSAYALANHPIHLVRSDNYASQCKEGEKWSGVYATYGCCGSQADISGRLDQVCFAPKNGHPQVVPACSFRAMS